MYLFRVCYTQGPVFQCIKHRGKQVTQSFPTSFSLKVNFYLVNSETEIIPSNKYEFQMLSCTLLDV